MVASNLVNVFRGERLRRAVGEQSLVSNDDVLAEELINVGEVVVSSANEKLYEAGSPCLGVYLILYGKLELLQHGNQLSQFSAGEQVGTWPVLYSDPTYDVTACTIEDSVFLRIGEHEFRETADKFPALWERLARTQADRLKKMNELFLPFNHAPRLLVGSSSESLPSARGLMGLIRKEHGVDIEVQLWVDIFPPGQSNLESLTLGLDDWDFAAFYLTPDDHIISRKNTKPAPRDNIIFEAGLCMGRLGRRRTFLISPQEPRDLKIPSDLAGIGRLLYVEHEHEILDKLLMSIEKLGSRTRVRKERLS